MFVLSSCAVVVFWSIELRLLAGFRLEFCGKENLEERLIVLERQ